MAGPSGFIMVYLNIRHPKIIQSNESALWFSLALWISLVGSSTSFSDTSMSLILPKWLFEFVIVCPKMGHAPKSNQIATH
jgi:hypothetical protein